MKGIYYIWFLLIISSNLVAQNGYNGTPEVGFWRLNKISGKVGLLGQYRAQNEMIEEFTDNMNSNYLSGNILLNVNSYIWHPNFLNLDIGAEYNPGSDRRNYIVSPEFSEILSNNRLDVRANFLEGKSMNFSTYLNLNQAYLNREYITNIKSNARTWGVSYSFRNKFLPLFVSYRKSDWTQQETETGRSYKSKQNNFQAEIRKDFNSRNQHSLTYSRNYNFTENQNFYQNFVFTNNLNLRSRIFFDTERKYSFQSDIYNLSQWGNLHLDRIMANEALSFDLPYKFKLYGHYTFNKDVQMENQGFMRNILEGRLYHQLYLSLNTSIFKEFQTTKHTVYMESRDRTGININYTKKIPMKGMLNMTFTYNNLQQNMDSKPVFFTVINEEYILDDGQIVLLNRPNVELNSVVIKDPASLMIYEEGLDYILIERNTFLEIRRITGGQIGNGQPIIIDYIAWQNGSYKYALNYGSFMASVTLFQDFFRFYFTNSRQRYYEVENENAFTANPFDQYVIGSEVNFNILKTGIVLDRFDGAIVPYERENYYLEITGKLWKAISYILHGDISNTTYLGTNEKLSYTNVFGNIIYAISSASVLNFNIRYIDQKGISNLRLLSGRTELSTGYRNIFFKFGFEAYSRILTEQELNFRGLYFKVERKF